MREINSHSINIVLTSTSRTQRRAWTTAAYNIKAMQCQKFAELFNLRTHRPALQPPMQDLVQRLQNFLTIVAARDTLDKCHVFLKGSGCEKNFKKNINLDSIYSKQTKQQQL